MLPLLLSAALFAPADSEPVVAAKGVPPTIVTGRIDKDGKLVTERDVTESVPVTRQEKVNVNGKEEVRTFTTVESFTTRVKHVYDLSKATVTTAAGKKIDKKDLAKRLEKATAVVMSADGKAIEKGYLQLFKADTIVIVAPPVRAGVQPGGGGATEPVRAKE